MQVQGHLIIYSNKEGEMVFIHVIVLLSHTYDGNQRCEMEGYGDRNRSIGKQKDEYTLWRQGSAKEGRFQKWGRRCNGKIEQTSVETT